MAYNHESDRRSNVSSFYGGRKSSIDALNVQEYRSGNPLGDRSTPPSQAHGPSNGAGSVRGAAQPAPTRPFTPQQDPARARRDSASSFFDPRRASQAGGEMLAQSAGYNRASFFDVGIEAPVKGGRDEEEAIGYGMGGRGGGRGRGPVGGAGGPAAVAGDVDPNDTWDVYADFNNAGPRYSSAFVKYDDGYQQLPPHSPEPGARSKIETESVSGPVEMVTVPALGAEWKKSELKAMRKSNKKKDRADSRWRKFRAWTRDQTGLCGKWGTRRQIAIGAFIVCVVVGVVLAFTIPRVPAFSFASQPLQNVTTSDSDDQVPIIFSRTPANFSFPANLHLQVDTGGSFVPIRFSKLHADLFDLQTSRQVGEGDLGGTVVPGKSFKEIFVPLNFTYVASNETDQTWANWYNACRNPGNYPNGDRPGLAFRIVLSMDIVGLIGSRKASTQVNNADCPVVLPLNAA